MRILGITLPEEKRIEIGLTVLYGVGRPLAHTVLDKAKVPYGLKPKELSVDQENTIRKPTRGQRTKTNARTKRGAKKTAGTGRKIADKK